MNILLVYATNSGGTEMAAQLITQQLAGHTVTMKRATEANLADIQQAEVVLLGSPSWDYAGKEGQPHDDFHALQGKIANTSLEGKKFAVFGLGDSSYKHFCGAVDEFETWITGWKGILVIPSLKIDKFFYQQAEATEAITGWCQKLTTALSG